MTVASLITISRIVLTILFGAYYIRGEILAAFFLFAAAGVSDLLDGYIARRFNMVSDLGKLLDPLADKLMILVGIGCLVWSGMFSTSWLTVTIVIELGFVVGALYFLAKGVVVHSGNYGKAASAFFTGSIGLGILGFRNIATSMLFCALLFGVLSLGYYALYFRK